MSAHDLMVEQGRYHRPLKLELGERKCSQCNTGMVEDENHVIMQCAKYDSERAKLMTVAQDEGVDMNAGPNGIFLTIMKCTSTATHKQLALFLKHVEVTRGRL